jgi:hypothetical protein
MKTLIKAALVLSLNAFLFARPGAIDAQEAKPQLYLVGDFLADTSRVGEYEAALRALLAGLEKHGFPFAFRTFSTDDNHYYTLTPLKDYAGTDHWIKAWGELGAKMGPEALPALQGRIVAAEIKRAYGFWYYRPDISFLPEKERLKPEEIGYYTFDFVWLIPGKEAEFEALNREWAVLSKAKGARDPFFTCAGDLGMTIPVYLWVEYGRSAADYTATEDEFWKAMGKEGADLSKRTRAVIRRMESKTGRYRPDLSYLPK